ncbi:MAG: CPBP family glutamic-type intramembrane protease [Agriterribacter sp.]
MKKKIYSLFKALIIILLATTLTALIVSITERILHQFGYDSIKNKLAANKAYINEATIVKQILIAVIIAPFVEEIIFRLPLNFEKRSIALSISLMVYRYSGDGLFTFSTDPIHNWLRFLLTISAYILTVCFLNSNYLKNLKNKKQKKVYYISAIAFGLIHISNFTPIQWSVFFVYPIYVLPQVIMGLLLANFRLRYGFLWGLLLHACLNGISVILKHL